MRATGRFKCGNNWYGFEVQNQFGQPQYECSEYGQSNGAGSQWFVWSKRRGHERCIVDDFGSLVVVQ